MNTRRPALLVTSLAISACGPMDPLSRMMRKVDSIFDLIGQMLLIGGVTVYVVLMIAALVAIVKNLRPESRSSGLGAALSVPHLIFGALGVTSVVVDGIPQPIQPDYSLLMAVDGMAAGSLVVGFACAIAAWRARGARR